MAFFITHFCLSPSGFSTPVSDDDAEPSVSACERGMDPNAELIPQPTQGSVDFRNLGHLVDSRFPPEKALMRIEHEIATLRIFDSSLDNAQGTLRAGFHFLRPQANHTPDTANRLVEVMQNDAVRDLHPMSLRANHGLLYWKLLLLDLVEKVERDAFIEIPAGAQIASLQVRPELAPRIAEELPENFAANPIAHLPSVMIPVMASHRELAKEKALQLLRAEIIRVERLFKVSLALLDVWLPRPAHLPVRNIQERLFSIWDAHPEAFADLYSLHPALINPAVREKNICFDGDLLNESRFVLGVITSFCYAMIQHANTNLDPRHTFVADDQVRDIATLLAYSEMAAVDVVSRQTTLRNKISLRRMQNEASDDELTKLKLMQAYLGNLQELIAFVRLASKTLISESDPVVLAAGRRALTEILTQAVEAVFGHDLDRNQFHIWVDSHGQSIFAESPPRMTSPTQVFEEDFLRLYQSELIGAYEHRRNARVENILGYFQRQSLRAILTANDQAATTKRAAYFEQPPYSAEIKPVRFFVAPLHDGEVLERLILIREGDGFARKDGKKYRFSGFSPEGVALAETQEDAATLQKNTHSIAEEDRRRNLSVVSRIISTAYPGQVLNGQVLLARRPILPADYLPGISLAPGAAVELEHLSSLLDVIAALPAAQRLPLPRVRIFDELGRHNREVTSGNSPNSNARTPGLPTGNRGGSSSN